VTWHGRERPWELEEQLIRTVCLPLNLDQNAHSAFHQVLTKIRREAKMIARLLRYKPESVTPGRAR
jgi:hypothetical protein